MHNNGECNSNAHVIATEDALTKLQNQIKELKGLKSQEQYLELSIKSDQAKIDRLYSIEPSDYHRHRFSNLGNIANTVDRLDTRIDKACSQLAELRWTELRSASTKRDYYKKLVHQKLEHLYNHATAIERQQNQATLQFIKDTKREFYCREENIVQYNSLKHH